jgi:predicted membrane protein DUF2085
MRASVPFGDHMPAVLRRAFIAAAFAWAVLLVAVPFIASRSHATWLGTAIVVAVYGIGGFVCHQLPERSWRLWTAQMPVCARCAGIYLGAAIAAVTAGARGFQPRINGAVASRSPERLALDFARGGEVFRAEREPFRRAGARVLLALAALPSLATLVYEWTSGIAPSNGVRFAAGIPIGVVVAWLVVSAAKNQVN